MRTAKEVNALKAVRDVWLARGDAPSITFDQVIQRMLFASPIEYSKQDFALFLRTVSSAVKCRGEEIIAVDIPRLDAKISGV